MNLRLYNSIPYALIDALNNALKDVRDDAIDKVPDTLNVIDNACLPPSRLDDHRVQNGVRGPHWRRGCEATRSIIPR